VALAALINGPSDGEPPIAKPARKPNIDKSDKNLLRSGSSIG
jgi:hypothetical protein